MLDPRPLPFVLLLSLATAGMPALAQQPLRSGVMVDESVLDALGPEPSLAARLLPDSAQRHVTTPIQMVAPGTARVLGGGRRSTASTGPRPAPQSMPRSGLTIATSTSPGGAPGRAEPPPPPPSAAGPNDVYRSPAGTQVASQAPAAQPATQSATAPVQPASPPQPPQISASVPPMPAPGQGQIDAGPRPAYPAPRATSAEPSYPPPPRPSTVPPAPSLPLSVEPAYKSRAGLAPSVSAPTPVEAPVPVADTVPAAPPAAARPVPVAQPAPPPAPVPPPPSPIPAAAPVAPVPPAVPAPARAAAPAQQTASAVPAPASRPAPSNGGRIGFDTGSTDLSSAARGELDRIASQLGTDEDRRLLIEAYAQKTADSESDARRLSLDRALMVRSYLGERGIRTTRIDVKAMGSRTSDAPDRADLTIVSGQ